MKYMLLLYTTESEVPENDPELYRNWVTLLQELKAAGVLLDNNGLAPVTNATTVRVRNGRTLTTDGPFAETHEQLGGYFVLELQDLDEAIRWAGKIPHATYGSVEIRPLWDQIQ
ncbi:MAG: YciI family protein [Chloroflexota bacterium]|nr:YciI family protein [Chloroflexota bacterium]